MRSQPSYSYNISQQGQEMVAESALEIAQSRVILQIIQPKVKVNAVVLLYFYT